MENESYFAAGCSTSNKRKIVAPSFVTVTSPISSTNILSNPTGPKELLTMLAIDDAAMTKSKERIAKLRSSIRLPHQKLFQLHFFLCFGHKITETDGA